MAKITAYDALTEVASGDIIPIVDVSDTTMGADGTNKKVTRATLLRDNLYGWMPAESTWTYASATTFTIAGVDRTSEYRKGGKIRWKQGGTYKYAYILSSAFSTDTTVTITGGSDYTIANSAITDNYVSYEVSPLGFPNWFNWTPTWTNVTLGAATNLGRFKMTGNAVFGVVKLTLTATTSFTGNVNFAPPIAVSASSGWVDANCGISRFSDAGTADHYGTATFSSGNIFPLTINTSETYATQGAVNASTPMTWTTGDFLFVEFWYEAI